MRLSAICFQEKETAVCSRAVPLHCLHFYRGSLNNSLKGDAFTGFFRSAMPTMTTIAAASPTSPSPATKKKRPTVSELANRVDTNRQGQEGVAWISWIVEGLWGCGVEVISASNDDGIDAIILLKRRPGLASYAGPTGDLIFAQIKTGYAEGVPNEDYHISLDAGKLERWRSKWATYPGPAVMIHVIPRRVIRAEAKAKAKAEAEEREKEKVDAIAKGLSIPASKDEPIAVSEDPVAYWTDLKRPESFQSNKVLFRLKNRFDAGAKSSFFNLCWRWAEFRKLPVIQINDSVKAFDGEKQPDYMGSTPMRVVARNYFKDLKKASKAGTALLQAEITWRGWEHITRRERPVRTKQQSIQLLPAVARILLTNSGVTPVTARPVSPMPPTARRNGQELHRGYDTLTARVVFYERHEAVIRVILERTKLFEKGVFMRETVIFYSVYEVARRKKSP